MECHRAKQSAAWHAIQKLTAHPAKVKITLPLGGLTRFILQDDVERRDYICTVDHQRIDAFGPMSARQFLSLGHFERGTVVELAPGIQLAMRLAGEWRVIAEG